MENYYPIVQEVNVLLSFYKCLLIDKLLMSNVEQKPIKCYISGYGKRNVNNLSKKAINCLF